MVQHPTPTHTNLPHLTPLEVPGGFRPSDYNPAVAAVFLGWQITAVYTHKYPAARDPVCPRMEDMLGLWVNRVSLWRLVSWFPFQRQRNNEVLFVWFGFYGMKNGVYCMFCFVFFWDLSICKFYHFIICEGKKSHLKSYISLLRAIQILDDIV